MSSDDAEVDLYRKMRGVLNPGGHLIVGSSETITPYSSDFETLRHDHRVFYRVKESHAARVRAGAG